MSEIPESDCPGSRMHVLIHDPGTEGIDEGQGRRGAGAAAGPVRDLPG